VQYTDAAANEFRTSMREWIRANAPAGLAEAFDWRAREVPGGNRGDSISEARIDPLYVEWERRCLESGLVCALWPVESGGQGWTRVQKAIFEEELRFAGLPRIDRGLGEFLVGPTILAHGTEEQKARLLPPIINGEARYCQGFSEPGAGSDLAGLQTRGVIDGDDLVITGHKIWTSGAEHSNMMFILCRTDPDAPKHKGITFAILPFSSDNNIEVRPIRQMSGGSDFAEEFINGARTPLANVIGGLNNGWNVTMTTLTFERDFNLPTSALEFDYEYRQVVERAKAAGKSHDPLIRQTLSEAFRNIAILRFFALRLLDDPHGASAIVSATKLYWSEYLRRFTEEALALEGPAALVRPAGEGYLTTPLQDSFFGARAATIYAGSSEIQRNIIAERVLGLPR
jgi:alkylation response protein AidB-like acyl-CoA dehydrogenase